MRIALAVAAYTVTGPIDVVVREPAVGVLSEDLRAPALPARDLDETLVSIARFTVYFIGGVKGKLQDPVFSGAAPVDVAAEAGVIRL